MAENRACGKLFPEKNHGKKFCRVSHGIICTYFSSRVTLKIHSTLPLRERRKRSLCLIALYVLPKKKVLEKRKAGFQMLSEQRYGNVRREQHLEVFKHWNTGCTLLLLLEEWKAVSCHFPSCHFQDQHLATLAPAVMFFFFPLHRQMV